MENRPSFLFLSVHEEEYSRTGNLYSGLVNLGYGPQFFNLKQFGISTWKTINFIKRTVVPNQIIVVGSGSQRLAILMRIFGLKRFIFDMGWTLTESYLSNRAKISILKITKIYFLDLLSIHLSSKILVESQQQKIYVAKTFFVKMDKLHVSFTGFDDTKYNRIQPVRPVEVVIPEAFILFRGKRNAESGMENIAALTRNPIFEDVKFLIATNKKLDDLNWGPNVTFITRRIEDAELAWLFLNCKLSLGQLSNSRRLRNTIPHKVFEACYFGTVNVLIKNSAAHLLLGDSACVAVELGEELARTLHNTLGDYGIMETKRIRSKCIATDSFTQEKITQKFLEFANYMK